jgi:hypothetical protein
MINARAVRSESERSPDSPLEEAVESEPVSEWREFPASWENTGNSSDSGLDNANCRRKGSKGQWLTRKIPYATEQGINSTVSGI